MHYPIERSVLEIKITVRISLVIKRPLEDVFRNVPSSSYGWMLFRWPERTRKHQKETNYVNGRRERENNQNLDL